MFKQRSIKSESQPSNWNSKAVKYIVGTTYESFIEQNKEKAIFINYRKQLIYYTANYNVNFIQIN